MRSSGEAGLVGGADLGRDRAQAVVFVEVGRDHERVAVDRHLVAVALGARDLGDPAVDDPAVQQGAIVFVDRDANAVVEDPGGPGEHLVDRAHLAIAFESMSG